MSISITGAAYLTEEALIIAIPGYPVFKVRSQDFARLLITGGRAGMMPFYHPNEMIRDQYLGVVSHHPDEDDLNYDQGLLIRIDKLIMDYGELPDLMAAICSDDLKKLYNVDGDQINLTMLIPVTVYIGWSYE